MENSDVESAASKFAFELCTTSDGASVVTDAHLIKSGVRVDGFCEPGDQVWEVRIGPFTDPRGTMHAVLWIDTNLERALGLSGPWDEFSEQEEDRVAVAIEVKEEPRAIRDEKSAIAIVEESYREKFQAVSDVTTVTRHFARQWRFRYSIDGFCARGDATWWVRIEKSSEESGDLVVGVAQINCDNGKLRWLIAPWLEKALPLTSVPEDSGDNY